MITIQQLKAGEMSIVQEIAYATWPDTFKEILSAEQIAYMLEWMYNLDTLNKQLESGHRFYVSVENGKALGFIGIELNYPDVASAKIHKIYILPEAQGLGLGKKLINKAIEVAIHNDMNKLLLNVNRFNQAVSFYEYLGFSIIKEENIDIGNDFWMEDYVMEYKLNK